MFFESYVALQAHNTFGIVARAARLLRVTCAEDLRAEALQAALADADFPLPADGSKAPWFILGGGSNIVLTGDVKLPVLKVEIKGLRLLEETPKAWIVEAGAGESWHDCVRWTLEQGYPGLENLALIPGTVGCCTCAKYRCLWRRTARPV